MSILLPGCKINLSLHVGSREANGYHNLDSIFLPLKAPSDIIKLTPGVHKGLELICATPMTGENILVRAYDLFSKASGYAPPLRLELEKQTPIGAGLGGGSADAACFLAWLNKAMPDPMDPPRLNQIAMELGSDVPFFLFGKPARVTSLGNEITAFKPPWSHVYVVLVWPDIFISTKWAFEEYDRLLALETENLTNIFRNNKNLSLSEKGDPFYFGNDLEWPVFSEYPQLADLKENFYLLGAFFSAMSGSGSTIYGLFSREDTAERAKSCLRKRHEYVYMTAMRFIGM